jgi:hypothetical protein
MDKDIEMTLDKFMPSSMAQQQDTTDIVTDDMIVPDDYSIAELSDEIKKEIRLRDEDKTTKDERIISNKPFVVAAVDMQEDVIRRGINKKEPMKAFNPKKPDQIGYVSKLRITYEDTSYVSLIPSVRWYPEKNDKGKLVLNRWFNLMVSAKDINNPMVSTISKLYYKYCLSIGKEPGKVSIKEFIHGLVGKKVILEQWMGEYEGKPVFRLDIHTFV